MPYQQKHAQSGPNRPHYSSPPKCGIGARPISLHRMTVASRGALVGYLPRQMQDVYRAFIARMQRIPRKNRVHEKFCDVACYDRVISLFQRCIKIAFSLPRTEKAKTGAECSRAYRDRKRKKGKAAAASNDQTSSSELVVAESSSAGRFGICRTIPHAAFDRHVTRRRA
jgi:hypothetical protein